jgi:lipoic acid synthetase
VGGAELPDWLKSKLSRKKQAESLKNTLKSKNLHTVCEEAKCPNIGECFSKGTATFLIMGKICARNCVFCSIEKGIPDALDKSEPVRVARQIKQMKLKYAVLTSPSRDDLDDGGASFFARTVKKIKEINFSTGVEVLIPDFKGDISALKTVLLAGIDVLNHNIETVKRLYPRVRPRADYERTLSILREASVRNTGFYVKSGFMVGLGEKKSEVVQLLRDLKSTGCNIITIGQYLRPTLRQLPVIRYLRPEEFKEIEDLAYGIGFEYVFSGPLVRSSYKAEEILSSFRKDSLNQLNGWR